MITGSTAWQTSNQIIGLGHAMALPRGRSEKDIDEAFLGRKRGDQILGLFLFPFSSSLDRVLRYT